MGSPLIGSFQTQVNLYNPYGVEGDFASANPRATALTADGGALIAGPNGVTIGQFAWIESDGRTVTNQGQYPAQPDGFVHRDQQGVLTQYLQAAGMLIPAGFPVTLMRAGDFLDKNTGPSSITRYSTLYASYLDGSLQTAAGTAGSVTATLGSTNTASLGATFTAAVSVASASLVVTAVTGLISIGDTVSGSGITDAPTIIAQTAGATPGGAGTYTLSSVETCSGGTVTCFGNVVKVTAVSQYISVGDSITHASYPASATITGQTSGTTGSTGVYTMSGRGTAYVASTTAVLTFGLTVTVTAVGSGSFGVGQPVVDATTGANIPANTVVESQISGTAGSTGVYTLSNPATAYAAGDNLTTTASVQLTNWTPFPLQSTACAVGDLVQITTWGA